MRGRVLAIAAGVAAVAIAAIYCWYPTDEQRATDALKSLQPAAGSAKSTPPAVPQAKGAVASGRIAGGAMAA